MIYRADLVNVNLDIRDGGTLDRLRRFLYRTVKENDSLDGEMFNPLDHGLGDLVVRLREQHLEGVIALADVHEDHLSALCTCGVYACADEDLLAVHLGGEIGDLDTRNALARGGLDERELAVAILCKVIVKLGLSEQALRVRMMQT